MTRRPLAALVAALSLVALFAAAPSRATVDSPSPLSTALCAADTAAPGPSWLTATPTGGCVIGRCTTAADCNCTLASGRSCVNHACSYTYPGGGGGGTTNPNPHGCRYLKCSSSADCPCMDGTHAACIGNACTF